MNVHVIVPVFNRLKLTQSLVDGLRKQKLDELLRILIVNDGSTDGTSAWLAEQKDIETLNGDGSLFWGGAVDLALRHLQVKAGAKDWVLLINNDTSIDEHFIKSLLDVAQTYAPAAVGCVIRDEDDHTRLLSIGACVDAWRMLTYDLLDEPGKQQPCKTVLEISALSGRGALFPISSLIAAGGMRPGLLPHYLADYEMSLRVRKAGWRLYVVPTVSVYSCDDYGSARRYLSWQEKLFSIRSPLYLPAQIVFWWEASSWLQRLTLPLRLPLFIFFPRLRKRKT